MRTRPSDRQKVLVTEKEVQQIENQWIIYHQQKEIQQLESDPEYLEVKEQLTKKYGFEPNPNDVRWSLLNRQLIEFSGNGNWGLYRNAKYEMAEILRKKKKLDRALQGYFEVCYLDINGPMNRGGINDPELLQEYPPFDPKQSFIAPAIIFEIRTMIKKFGLSNKEAMDSFLQIAEINHNSLKLPVEPVEAWKKIETEIFQ